MKKYFITGIAILLPFALTIAILLYLIDFFTAPFLGLTEKLLVFLELHQKLPILSSEALILTISRIITLVFLFALTLFLGFLGQKVIFHSVLNRTNRIISKIPFVKSIYQTTKDISHAIFSNDKKIFKEPILLPFPSKETKALGFLVGNVPDFIKKVAPELEVSIFMPTAPHPISGFLLFTTKKEVQSLPVSTEDTFKFIISCGSLDLSQKKEPRSHEEL